VPLTGQDADSSEDMALYCRHCALVVDMEHFTSDGQCFLHARPVGTESLAAMLKILYAANRGHTSQVSYAMQDSIAAEISSMRMRTKRARMAGMLK